MVRIGYRLGRGVSGGVLMTVLAAFGGCAGPEDQPAPITENPKYNDIPVPFNFRQEPSRGQAFVAFRVADLHYIGSARIDRTADWYAAQMPKLGWSQVGSAGAQEDKKAVCVFDKGQERCTVTIAPRDGLTGIHIEITYKNASGT